MRESWTDDRLDYLNRRVDDGFKQVDERFKMVDQRFDRVEAELRTQRVEAHAEFRDLRAEMHARFDGVQRAILLVGGGIVATLAVGVLAVLAK